MSFRRAYGNDWSENGWRMCNRDECVLVPGPGMNTAPLRGGAPAIILGDFVRRHHVEVEPIIGPVWGWSNENDVGNSNHLAGTAVDVRASVRPWGALVLSSAIVAKTNVLLDKYRIDGERGIYWGRNWNRHDEMHFQCNWKEGDPRNARLVALILGGGPGSLPVIKPPITSPGGNAVWPATIQYGSQGAVVLEYQRDMNKVFRGYPQMPLIEDGEFGPATKAATQEFQRRSPDGLTPDGIVGPLTWTSLAKFGVRV